MYDYNADYAEKAAYKAAALARDEAERANPALRTARLAAVAVAKATAAAERRLPLPDGDPYSDVVLTERLRRARTADRAAGEIAECETLLGLPFERREDVKQLARYLLNTTPGLRWSDALCRAASAPQSVYDNRDRHLRHVAEFETELRWADEDGTALRKAHVDAQYVTR